jgi:imidazolonepropionase-like amidohydrolase
VRLRFSLREPGSEPVLLDVAGEHWELPEGAGGEVIGEGMWALPGLVDAHAHFAAAEGQSWVSAGPDGAASNARRSVAAGVMLALDKGWSDLTAVEMLARVDPGERPDIDAAGVVLAVEGGYLPDFAREIDPDVIGDAVALAAKEGSGWVKLIGDWPRKGQGPVANFSEAQLSTAVRVAVDHGARVAIHTMARDVPSIAVDAGVHSIEHGMFLSESDLARLGERGGMWVPTVLQVEAVIAQLGGDSSGGRLLREGLENVTRLLSPALEAGVQILTGTDLAVGPRQVGEEAVRLWELGMPAKDVVAAVSNAGLVANDRVAGFEPRAPANAVFFDSDPVADPRVLLHPSIVVRLGRVIA